MRDDIESIQNTTLQIHSPITPFDSIVHFYKTTNMVSRFIFYGIEGQIIKIIEDVLRKNPDLWHLHSSNMYSLLDRSEKDIIDRYLSNQRRSNKTKKPILYTMLIAWKLSSLPLPSEIWAKIFLYFMDSQYELYNLMQVCTFFRNRIKFTPGLLVKANYQTIEGSSVSNCAMEGFKISAIAWLKETLITVQDKVVDSLQRQNFLGIHKFDINTQIMALNQKLEINDLHASPIFALHCFDDYIVCGGADKLIRVYGSHDLNLIKTIKHHKIAIVAIVGNDHFFITADYAGIISLWNNKTFKLIGTIEAEKGVKNIALSNNTLVINYLCTQDLDFWDIKSLKQIHHEKVYVNDICGISNDRFALTCKDKIWIFDAEKCEYIHSFEVKDAQGSFVHVKALPNKQMVAQFRLDNDGISDYLYIFDLNLMSLVRVIESSVKITYLSVNSGGDIAAVDNNGDLQTWCCEHPIPVATSSLVLAK